LHAYVIWGKTKDVDVSKQRHIGKHDHIFDSYDHIPTMEEVFAIFEDPIDNGTATNLATYIKISGSTKNAQKMGIIGRVDCCQRRCFSNIME